MSATKNSKKISQQEAKEQIIREFDSDVLFQKIYGKWYAFSMVEGECLMTEVTETEAAHFNAKASKR